MRLLICLGLLAGAASAKTLVHDTHLATTAKFQFVSDPWMNLHHFLYASATQEKSDTVPQGHGVEMPDRAPPETMSEDERATWTAAVEFYRVNLGAKRLTFDAQLIALKRRHWDTSERRPAETPMHAQIEAVIASAMPVYLHHWWPAHDRSNRAWLAAVLPIVQRWETRFADELGRIYGGQWPAEPVRVDLTAYTDYYGAYNTGEPHVVLATQVAKNAPPQGIELLFHEASHSESLGNGLYSRVADAATQAGVRLPRDLWHVLIFVTTGELTRRYFAEEGGDNYVPYAVGQKLYADTSPWGRYHRLAQQFWVPKLDAPAAERLAAYDLMVRENARLIAPAAGQK